MRLLKAPVVVLAVSCLLTATACAGPSRSEVLSDLADELIVPTYERLEQRLTALSAAADSLCDDPTSTHLADARRALTNAREAWSNTEPVWVGPVMDRRSWAVIDWPISTDEIMELIDDGSVVLDLEQLGKGIGADQRGLGAIEHILGDPTEIIRVERVFEGRRCEYLTGISTVASDESELLTSDWKTTFEGAAPYRDTFADVQNGALDSLVNNALFLLEDIADRELGTALGETGPEANIDRLGEGLAGLGARDIEHHLVGLRSVLVGDEQTAGIAPLLDDELVERLTSQVDDAVAAADAIQTPLRSVVVNERDKVQQLRAAVKELQVTVATEVVSQLGVTIGFSDADGDTGS